MSLWKNHQFTRFFVVSSIGNLGDWFDIFAVQILFLHEWHASPILLGTLVLFFFLPSIVLGPFAGVWVDRLSRRNVMLITDALACLLTFALFLNHQLYIALAIVLVRGAVTSFNIPAQQAYVKFSVTDDQLLKATSYTTVSFQLCKVLGPMLGALVVSVYDARACIFLNAFSFLLSVSIMSFLKKDAGLSDKAQQALHWLQDTTTGLKYIFKNRLLRYVVMMVMCWFYCSMLRQAQLVLILHHIMPHEKSALGVFMGLDGLGAVTTSYLLSRLKHINNFAITFFSGFILLSLGVFGIGFYHIGWPSFIVFGCALIIGFGSGILLVAYGYILKNATPNEQIGRVSGTSGALQNAGLALGTISSGLLVVAIGIREMYFLISAILFVLSLLSLVVMRLSRVNT